MVVLPKWWFCLKAVTILLKPTKLKKMVLAVITFFPLILCK